MESNEQQIRFCRSPDEVSIAYASVGSGPPLVKAANWLSHLEYDWKSPVWRHWITELSRYHTFIRYDERGCGLSDWNVEEFSLDAWVCDLETVINATKLDRFPLLGISQGGPIAIAYALRHPEKVTQLVLYGSYAAGLRKRRLPEKLLEEAEVFLQLIKLGWGKEHAAFRQVFTSLFIPDATTEQTRWFNELQRVSSTPENAARLLSAFYELDVREQARELKVPTLVLHAKGDLRIPFDEGRRLAALIPDSRFVPLESRNHILLKTEPAWQSFLNEIHTFLGVNQDMVQQKHGPGNSKASPAVSGSRWKEISALFEQAVQLGTAERNELLARVDDSDLRRQVETLLDKDAATSLAPELGEMVKHSVISFNEARDDLTASSISHYRILEKLGEGGMGTIYRAHDERLDRFVALKFLPPYLSMNEELKRRFIREARAAAALDHANICTVFEIGETANGQLFIAMPCYQGETLREKIERGPLEISETLDYAVQTLEGLAHAHAGGIVHRDIKPANLFVTNAGQIKILDFGVAKVADANVTSSGMLVGTVAYMSPEQASGKVLDYRTDIWSLGVVLYEMLTGRHPFAGESGEVSLYAIRHERAPSIIKFRSDAPTELDTVLRRLLAKEPDQRFVNVEEVLSDLKHLEEKIGQRRTATRQIESASETRSIKKATTTGTGTIVEPSTGEMALNTFVGRELELQRLEMLLERACAGAGQIVFITGEPGLGKTSLVNEFLRLTTHQRPEIVCLTGHCVEQYGASEAYLPFLNAFSGLLSGPQKELVAPALLSHAPAWSMQFPSVFTASDVREQLRRETMGATQERMLREMCDYLTALANHQPMILLLEDLHWADPPSVQLIRYLGQMIERMRLLLIGTYRPEELESNNRLLRDCARELMAHDQCNEIELGMLNLEAIANHLNARFSPNEFSQELALLIERKTGGHPLFTTRLARELGERGAIIKRNSHWALAQDITQISLEMPESVLALIRRRIDTLTEADRRLVQYASTQGEAFLSPVLAQLLSSDQLEIEEQLDRLARSSYLLRNSGEEELPDGSMATRYRFAHALYQNVLYGDLVGERRRQLHRQTGEFLEKLYGDKSNQIAAQLAMHFERSRDFGRAIPYLVKVGDNSARVHATAEAVEHYNHALELELAAKLPQGEFARVSLPIYLKLGTASLACSRFDEAISNFERAIELARESKDFETEHAALNGLILTFFISHRMDQMTQRSEEAIRLSERSTNTGLRFETLAYLAQRNTCYGELDEAIKLNEQIIAEADPAKDQAALAMAILQRGELHLHQSEYAQAEKLLEQGANKALALGDNFKHMYRLFMLGMAQANLGKISRALATFNRLSAIAERNSDRAWLVRCPNCIGWIYREMQDFERAVREDRQGADLTAGSEFQEVLAHSLINLSYDYLERGAAEGSHAALDQAEEARDRDLWMQWRHNIRLQGARAEYWLARDDANNAERHANELLRVATQHRCRKYVALAHKILGEIALLRGRLDQAEMEFQAAVAQLHEFPAPLLAWKVYSNLGRLLLEKGDLDSGRQAFADAASIIKKIAANTEEDELRQTFLNSAPVMEVFEKWD